MFHKAILAAALFGSAIIGGNAQAQSISIALGAGPSDYLPLELFGIAPVGDLTGDGHIGITGLSVGFPGLSVGFAGKSWDRITVAENGFVTLGNGVVPNSLWSSTNLSLPDAGITAPILAPFWTDIDATGGNIRVGSLTNGPSTWLVIDWAEVQLPGSATLSSFQLWLGVGVEDISFVYDQRMGSTDFFTVGAQDGSGTVGTNYLYNSGALRGDLKVISTGFPVELAVPETSTWAMMIVGMGLVGGLLRRRQVAVRFV